LALFAFFFSPNYSSATAAVSFSQDTNLSLTGISDGDIMASSGSSAESLSFSGAELTVNAISDASYFTLKTPTYNNALKITPSSGTSTLVFNSSNLSSGRITTWTLTASTSNVTIAHILSGTANTWYAITADGSALNSYQTNSSGELTFTYSGGFSTSHTFSASVDASAPASFSLTSPVNNSKTSSSKPTFSWNASSDPDLSYYQLYIDGALDTSGISSASKIPTGSLTCGAHTWYVKAVDSAGNSTNSETFNLAMVCEGSGASGAVFTNMIQPKPQTVYPDGTVVYHNQEQTKNDQSQTSGLASSNPTTAKPPVSFFFAKLLKTNSRNSDVKNLQIALNNLGFAVASPGLGSKGNETDYYGKATREAIKKFQCKYNIACQGKETTTGWGAMGPKTREKLNEMMKNDLQQPVAQSSQPPEETPKPPPIQINIPTSANAVSAIQKQIEDLQNQLLEMLNKQLKDMTKKISP